MSDEQGSVLDQVADALAESNEEVIENVEAGSEEVSEESAEVSAESSEEAVEVSADTEEELEEELQAAADEGASDEELTNMVRQYTLKVGGKEYVRELDLNDEDAIKRALQLEIAGRQAMQSNAEIKKSYDNDIQRLKENPWSVLEELGIDPVELAAKRIEDHLAQNKKSPEEVEQDRRVKEYDDMKAEIEAMKKEKEDSERASQMAAAEKEIESDIISALDGDNDLESSPEVVNMVVDSMLWAMNNGFQDVTAKDVLPTVKAEIQKKYRSYAKSMKSTTALKSLLGDDILNNLREERLDKIKNQVKSVNSIKSTSAKQEKEEKSTKKKVSISDFMSGR